MAQLQTEVLVIGGGATGAGVARDAAMRGFDVVLVERKDLAEGTTGRFHGLLHSGGRYAVKDPRSARECMDENRVLRSIAADFVINASGAWAGQLAAMAGGREITVLPGKGIMIAMNHRVVNTVINRLVMPSD